MPDSSAPNVPGDPPDPAAPAGPATPVPEGSRAGVDLTLGQLEAHIEGFLTDYLKRKSPETVGTYRRALHEFVRFVVAEQGRFHFREADVERYKAYLSDERGLHQVSISTYLTAVRRLCQYLVDLGVLGENPAKAVKGNRRPSSHSRSVLTLQEVEALLQSLPSDTILDLRDRALVYLMLGAGLSEIELVRADREDFEDTLLGHVLRVQGKGHTAKDQAVKVDDRVAAAVKAYLDVRGETGPSEPLFASHGHRASGERLNTRSVRTRIKRALTEAGIRRPGITPHSLTHTAALLWLNAGMSVDEVRQRMRHGTLDTTMIYLRQQGLLHRTPEDLARLDAERTAPPPAG